MPGPCPTGTKGLLSKAGDKAADLAKLGGSLSAKVARAATDKVKAKYGKLQDRYGKGMAIAILAAGIVGLPMPVPGSSLLLAAPLIAAGELYRGLHRSRRDDEDPDDYTVEELLALGQKWMEDIIKEWAANEAKELQDEDSKVPE